jgi:predicted metal-dependent peptidase
MLPANEDTETRYERLKDIIPDVRVITIDDHATWAEIMANGQLASAVVKVVVAQAWDKLSPEQKSKITLPPQVREAVEKAVREAGSMVIDAGANSVPWQTILKKYVGRALMRRPMFGRVPRRFPELVGVIPATGRSKTKPHIVFCLDTSGSMTASVLCDISAELVCIAKSHQVTVIEADDAVRAVYKFRGPLTSVTGRRGTDFRLAFEEAAKLKPDLLIYGTDGFGKAPAPAPRFETIWLLTPSGRKPTSWGREVRMQG